MSLSSKIKELADSNGIDALGFTDASEFRDYKVADSKRKNPKLSLPAAQTVIVAGVYIGGLKLRGWMDPYFGRTSRLYLSGFFADVIKPLEPIKAFLTEQGYKAIICDSLTDESSVLPLKLAAIRAGFGWQGKNSLLITKKFGTFLALGGIITDAVLDYSEKTESDHCGTCSRCRESCPTKALDNSFMLNKKKCLAYLLQQEQLPPEAKMVTENRIGDCEICQDVCPWNKKHTENPLNTASTLSFKKKMDQWEKIFSLDNLISLSQQEYKTIFDPLRTGIPYSVFRRNAMIALEHAKK